MDFEPLACRPRINDADMFAGTVPAHKVDVDAPAVEVGKASKCLCPHFTRVGSSVLPAREEAATAL